MQLDPNIMSDYAFYLDKFRDTQAVEDAFNDRFGFPRSNLAWQHAMKRHHERLVMNQELMAHYTRAIIEQRTLAHNPR